MIGHYMIHLATVPACFEDRYDVPFLCMMIFCVNRQPISIDYHGQIPDGPKGA
jgi:hypothetical protein